MSDDKEKSTVDAKTLEAMQAELATLQAKLSEEAEARKAAEAKFQDSIESRQKAKEQARKDAEEKGEYEIATKLLQEQLADTMKKLEDLSPLADQVKTLEGFKTKFEEMEAKRKTELLEAIPEEKREEFKDMPVDSLERIISLIPDAKVNTHRNGAAKPSGAYPDKWSEFSPEQRVKAAAELSQEKLNALMSGG